MRDVPQQMAMQQLQGSSMRDESIWCPGCSREVDGPCHHFNCAVGPHGLDAQIKTAARTEWLEQRLQITTGELVQANYRIEALEAALREIMDCEELDAFTLQDIARAALAPEQDK